MSRPLREIEVAMLIFSIPAILSVLARILLRRNRLWADDICALMSSIALVVQFAAVFIYTSNKTLGAIRYYIIAVAFYTIIWTARLSLLFSVIRIDPNKTRRTWLYVIGTLYMAACPLLITQLFWICQHEAGWKTMATPQCHLTLSVAIAQLMTDIVADGTLLLAPILLFRTLSDQRLSRRLMAIFSTCVITTVVSLVHATLLLRNAGQAVLIAGVVEDCISLIVCNIPVIAAAIVRHQNGVAHRRRRMSLVLSTIAFRPNDRDTYPNLTFGSSLGSESVASDKNFLSSKSPENISRFNNTIDKCYFP